MSGSVPSSRERRRNRIRKLAGGIRTFWVMVGICLLMYGCVETPAYISMKFMKPLKIIDPEFMGRADTYGGASWAQKLCEDTESVRNNWEPFVYFAPKPMATEMLSIDEQGLRRTVGNAHVVSASTAITIKVFGGSTMFGYGARDAYTIPSILARLLNAGDLAGSVRVINHGRIAYVTNQEVLQLETELKEGRVPQIVVFYDGVNETETAMMGLRAGCTYSEGRLAAFVEPRDESALAAVKMFFGRSPTLRFLERYKRRNNDSDVVVRLRAADTDTLAREVAEMYFRNIAHVRKLGEVYGFDCLFYWQPTMYQKRYLTAFEESIFERPWYESLPPTGCPEYRDFYGKTYAAVRYAAQRNGIAEFRDISLLFANDREPRYIDPQHLAETGNDVVARRMLDDIRPIVERRMTQRN